VCGKSQVMGDFITYKEDPFPLVRVIVHHKKPTEQDTNDHFENFKAYLTGGRPFVILFDVTHAPMVPMAFVHRQAEFMKDMEPFIQTTLIASAVVSHNVLVRGLLDILFKIRKPIKPNKVTKKDQKAVDFLYNHYMAFEAGHPQVMHEPDSEDEDEHTNAVLAPSK